MDRFFKLFLGQHNLFRKKRAPGSCSTSWKLIKVFFSVATAPGTHNMLPQLGSCRDETTVWWTNRGCLTIYLPFSICLSSPAVLEPFRQGQKNWMHIKYLFSATSVNNCVGVLQKTEKEDRCTIKLTPIKGKEQKWSLHPEEVRESKLCVPPWLPQNCIRNQRGLTTTIPSYRFLSSSVELYFRVFGTDKLTNTSYQMGLNAHFLQLVFLLTSNMELLQSLVHLRWLQIVRKVEFVTDDHICFAKISLLHLA